jgi:hypothetical protein
VPLFFYRGGTASRRIITEKFRRCRGGGVRTGRPGGVSPLLIPPGHRSRVDIDATGTGSCTWRLRETASLTGYFRRGIFRWGEGRFSYAQGATVSRRRKCRDERYVYLRTLGFSISGSCPISRGNRKNAISSAWMSNVKFVCVRTVFTWGFHGKYEVFALSIKSRWQVVR